jgi:hypothetical protein
MAVVVLPEPIIPSINISCAAPTSQHYDAAAGPIQPCTSRHPGRRARHPTAPALASVYLTVRGSWSLGVHAGGREQARGICDGPGCRKDSGLGLVTGPDEAGFVGEDDCLDPVA